MDFLPAFLDIRGRDCLVVGGGEVAARKVAMLRRAGGQVCVVAKALGRTLRAEAETGLIRVRLAAFEPKDLDGCMISIAATDDENVNRAVAEAARVRNIPVNVVDRPALCTFVMPSVLDRSPLLVAVTSGGASPVLARLLRARLETLIPAAYGRLASLAGRFRERVRSHFQNPADRRVFWERTLQGPVAEYVLTGRDAEADQVIERSLAASADGLAQGEVYLVGAGPGDPDLLTFRALRLMQQADVVVHDRLVTEPILELCRRDAERIYVGKERDRHTLPQEGINQLLVRLAKEGRRVVRLKGGDPFIFGRGGEEIEALAAQGVAFEIVPGVTAAAGAAAYAGIPLTHRD